MAERRKKASRKTARKGGRKTGPKRWSQRVTRESDALDLKRGVFKQTSARKIAASLKRSAEHSTRHKSGAYRSALSMLTFTSTAPARPCRRRNASAWSARR